MRLAECKLALGTVQFGIAYGIVGRATPIGDDEARAILARAAELGIDTLDTAPAYGDIEQRLDALAGRHRFKIVTKIPPLPAGTDAAAFVRACLDRSLARLGGALGAVLFHQADDLLGPRGSELWTTAAAWAADHRVRLGVSCYGPAQLQAVGERFPVAVAQLPGNVFDQRLAGHSFPGVELHLRSAFLQGLLIAPLDEAAARLPVAAAALRHWHAACAEHGLPPLTAALGVVKALPGVDRCVVGVDSLAQLEQIAAAWDAAPPLELPEPATDDPAVIDPRTWSRT